MDNVWSILLLLWIAWLFFGESIENAFFAIINRNDKRRLTRKEEKSLRQRVDDQQAIISVATEIMRDVQAADQAFPQLPLNTKEQVDEFLDVHRPRPTLPAKKKIQGK